MSAKTLALTVGIVVIIAGLIGFVANPLVGAAGYFATNVALDVVYIIIGIVLVGAAVRMPGEAPKWMKIAGVIYLVIAILGFLMASPVLGFLAVNMATNWLHVVLGLVLIGGAYWANGRSGVPMM